MTVEPEGGGDDRPFRNPEPTCGHHFWPNGDLSVYYRRGNLIVEMRWGFRGGEKVLVDSSCEEACLECGCPKQRYHAMGCKVNVAREASVIVSVYADGGVIGANPSPKGGTWAWCHVNDADKRIKTGCGLISPRKEYPKVTNNLTEFAALLFALEALPFGWSGKVHSDSKITLGRFFQGFKCKGIPEWFIERKNTILSMLGDLDPVHVHGHPTRAELAAGRGDPHNVWCDSECRLVAKNAS